MCVCVFLVGHVHCCVKCSAQGLTLRRDLTKRILLLGVVGSTRGGGFVRSWLPHLCLDQNLDLVQAYPAAFVFQAGSLQRAHRVGMVFGLF